jgi:hypothetical protein
MRVRDNRDVEKDRLIDREEKEAKRMHPRDREKEKEREREDSLYPACTQRVLLLGGHHLSRFLGRGHARKVLEGNKERYIIGTSPQG